MTRLWWLGTVRLAAISGICAATAVGQGAPGRGAVCHGETVSRIDIQTLPPFESGGPAIAARLAQIATSLHATTNPDVIARYLVLHVGEPCTDLRIRESERILRAQPFLADANIVAASDGNGGVAISVLTTDEISLVLDGSASSKSPVIRAVRIGDQNISGEAISGTAGWQHGELYRDIYKARIQDFQFLGRPYQLMLQGARNEIGGSWDLIASHPFLTDLQRMSWRVSAGSFTGYRYFKRPNAEDPALRFTRTYSDVGGVRAIGPVGHVFLLGATLSRELERTEDVPVIVHDHAIMPDSAPALLGRYGTHQSSRVNLLLGFRNIHFLRVQGFDAVEGTQDVRTGVQLATLLGRGLKLADNDERDYFMSGSVYAGMGTPQAFAAVEFMTERRYDLDTHTWDGILASGRAAWYLRTSPRRMSSLSVEYSGGWRQRVPFQLTFADREGGIRGYRASDLGGGERLVTRLEQRYRLGHIRQFAGLAGAVFVDAGKLWAGDAPFGTTTGVDFSAGVGLLAALPPRSRRTWRVDLAFPLNDRGETRKYEIRFTNHDFTRWFWREPGDVQAGRERSIPNSVYNWP